MKKIILIMWLLSIISTPAQADSNQKAWEQEIIDRQASAAELVNFRGKSGAHFGEALATLINLNGMLCAKPLSVRDLDKSTIRLYMVRCIEHEGKKGEAWYITDIRSSSAQKIKTIN